MDQPNAQVLLASAGRVTAPSRATDRSRPAPQPFVVRHWLALLNLAAAVWAGLPLAAPALMAAGWHTPALAIYALYQVACHQWPGRSYFLFGPRLVYGMDELQATGVGMARDFVGNAAMGFKVAYCERDLAIYTSVLLAGLLYALLRRHARPLPWPVFAVCLLPIAVDGFTQLFGLRESSWELRTLTGALTGVAGVWLVYPRIALAMQPPRHSPAGVASALPGAQGAPISLQVVQCAHTGPQAIQNSYIAPQVTRSGPDAPLAAAPAGAPPTAARLVADG